MRKKKRAGVRRRKRRHVSVFDRTNIGLKRKEGWGVRAIATLLNRPPSTISRELKRNASGSKKNRYHLEAAHTKAMVRKESHGTRALLKCETIRTYATEKLKIGWSPEQIALRLPIDHRGLEISYEAIYQYVYAQVARGGNGRVKKGCEDLRPYLARRHTRRQKKGFRRARKAERPVLPSIEERPTVADRRIQIGHWEDDTMVSRQSSGRFKTINERVAGVVLIGKMKDGSIAESNRVVIDRLSAVPARLRKTLIRDRGTENLGWKEIEEELNLTCWFAHAYCSRERGSNENVNGLIRRFFPKKTDLTQVTDAEVRSVEYLLNTRPRKRFGGKTPLEVLWERTGVALNY